MAITSRGNPNGPATKARNVARRAARVSRRKEYWASVPGQKRRSMKMNTAEKIEKREKSILARNQRRIDRKRAEALASKAMQKQVAVDTKA
jgi:hypothetical protein